MVLRRSVLLGGGTVVALLAGVGANKAYSTLLGPEGFGVLALGRSLVWTVGVLTGAVLGPVLVREGAAALAAGAPDEFAGLKRACLRLSLASAVAGLAIVAARRPLGEWLFASSAHDGLVAAAALALCATVAASIETGDLAARHDHRRLARTTAVAALMGGVAGVWAVWQLGTAGLGVVLVVPPLVTWTIARRGAARTRGRSPDGALRRVLRAAAPLTVSTLLGGGIEYLFPVVLVHAADGVTVGLFRAAHALSVGYLAFLGTILAQEYFPRVSALGSEAPLSPVVNRQLRLVAGVAAVLAVAGVLAARSLLTLAFSPAFAAAAPLLALMMAGNVLRLPSWCLTYAVLSRSPPWTYLVLESVGAALTLGLSALGLALGGLRGLGAGFVAGYFVYFLCAWATLARTTTYRLDARTAAVLAVVLASVGVLLAMRPV